MAKSKVNSDTELTAMQENAIHLLACGKSISKVAIEIEIDRATLYNWLKMPEFEAYYNKLRLELKDQAKNELLSFYNDATATLKECLKSDNENIRLKACTYILNKIDNYEFGLSTKKEIEEKKLLEW